MPERRPPPPSALLQITSVKPRPVTVLPANVEEMIGDPSAGQAPTVLSDWRSVTICLGFESTPLSRYTAAAAGGHKALKASVRR